MVLRALALTLLKRTPLRVFQLPPKEYNKFLGLIFSNSQVRNGRNYATVAEIQPIDSVHIWKYLDFMVQENRKKQNCSEEFDRVISLLQNKKDIEKEIKSLESMSTEGDKELEKLIQSEKSEFLQSIKRITDEILELIMTEEDENDNRNVELRVIAGIGGEEAKLFSEELITMYMNYAELKNWECYGDYKDSFVSISGDNVFGYLKHEGGVHRVQRVPATEKSGRIHTSTCSVVVLPQPKPHEIKISERDLIVEKLKSSGPGGQNVNKRETCVRIKHIPTGITIENQTARYQHDNLKTAIQRLRVILFNIEQEKLNSKRLALRKEQAGVNDYSDKIRTYNFPQNRVTDHRINVSTQNLKGFLSGKRELDEFICQVRETNRRKELLSQIRNTLESVEYKNFEKQQTR